MSAVVDTEKDFDRKTVDAALEAWARWARRALAELGWSPMSIIAKLVRYGAWGAAQQAGIRVLEIDETCETVDKALLHLDEVEREVVMRTYLFNEAAQVTAEKCGLTYEYYRNLLSRGRRRVGDFLAGAKSHVVPLV